MASIEAVMSASAAQRARVVPHWAIWVAFAVGCNAVGFASSLFGTERSYYEALPRPSWSPPPAVFGPVWTLLYTMMGTATYLIWVRTSGNARRRAITVFALQLALNFAWTPVFFGLHRIGVALVVIVAVWASVLAMMIVYMRRVRVAGLLVAPLLAWVTFATALNFAIWHRAS